MNTSIARSQAALAALALAVVAPLAPSLLGDEGGQIQVDAVVEMTDAGTRIAHPTPGRPAYYLPLPVGYKPQGAFLADQKMPPPTPEVEHMLAVALAQQGYLVMSRAHAPSLVLTLWWGYMAPEINSTNVVPLPGATNVVNITQLPLNGGMQPTNGVLPQDYIRGLVGPSGVNASGMDYGLASALMRETPTDQMFNNDQMMSLVAGSADSYQYSFQNSSLIYDEVRALARSPRHYLMVSAFDFRDWLHHKTTLLWRAHISTDLWGHSLAEVMPTLIETGAPLFGRETGRPRLFSASLGPVGRVSVGTPQVTNYGPTP